MPSEGMHVERIAEIKRDLERGGDAAQWPSAAVRELVAEVERYREALRQITNYDTEAHHGPVDKWAEAEAFAEVSEIAAGALYYWEKQEQGL